VLRKTLTNFRPGGVWPMTGVASRHTGLEGEQ
jgi:hypothetical protein